MKWTARQREYLARLLISAKEAHTKFEQEHPELDHSDWPVWYANYVADNYNELDSYGTFENSGNVYVRVG